MADGESVASKATGAVSNIFNTAVKIAKPALALGAVFSLVALSGGGVAALGGASFSNLAMGVGEGVAEGATHLADGAEIFSGWVNNLSA